MAVNNQILAGTACLALIVLVVASGKKDEPSPEWVSKIKTEPDVAKQQAQLRTALRDAEARWNRLYPEDILSPGGPTETQISHVHGTLTELRKRADNVYGATPSRSAAYEDFEENFGNLATRVEQARAKLTTTGNETETVPVDAGAVKKTATPATVVSFETDGPGQDADLPLGSNTTPVALDRMVEEFSDQQTSVAVSDNQADSAFSQLPTGRAAPEEKPEGQAKQSRQDAKDGLENPQASVVPAVLVDVPLASTFNTISDPPTHIVEPSKPEESETQISQEERVRVAQDAAAVGGAQPSFLADGTPAQGTTPAEIERRIATYAEKVNKYHRYLTMPEYKDDKKTGNRLSMMQAHLATMADLMDRGVPREAFARSQALYKRAREQVAEVLGSNPAKRKVAPDRPVVHGIAKRQRTDSPAEAQARVESERSPQGEPAFKKRRPSIAE